MMSESMFEEEIRNTDIQSGDNLSEREDNVFELFKTPGKFQPRSQKKTAKRKFREEGEGEKNRLENSQWSGTSKHCI